MKFQWKDIGIILMAFGILLVGAISGNSILAALITILFGVYALFNHKNALLLLFIYIPTRPFLTEFNPALKAVGDVIIFIVLLKVVYLNRKNWKSLFDFHLFEYAFFAFCAVGSIAAYIQGVSITAIIFQLRSFILLYLVYYIVKRLNITKKDVEKFAWTIVVVTTIICIHGLIEKLSLRGLLLPQAWEDMPLSATNRIRIYGLAGNPNGLALYLSFALIVILYMKTLVKTNTGKWLNVLLILTAGVWMLTFSRGTWVAFILGMIIYIILSKNWRTLRNILVYLTLGILLIVLPISGLTSLVERSDYGTGQREIQKEFDQTDGGARDRLKETFDVNTIEGSKDSGRLYIVKTGFEVFKNNPIIGTGFGTFGDSATLSYGSPIYEEYGVKNQFYSDNQYIQIIAQTGMAGVILFATFLLGMLYVIWKTPHSNMRLVMISILLGTYIISLVYNTWESDIFTLMYFTMLGYLLQKVPHYLMEETK